VLSLCLFLFFAHGLYILSCVVLLLLRAREWRSTLGDTSHLIDLLSGSCAVLVVMCAREWRSTLGDTSHIIDLLSVHCVMSPAGKFMVWQAPRQQPLTH
jgi:hypothetical protein